MAQAQVLPKELRLNAPPTMPQARTYLFKQASVEQTQQFGNTVTINLPRLQRSYLTKDSYLRFDLHLSYIAGTGAANGQPCWDTPGAFGAIDKIEVFDYLGSTLLESTTGHGQLMALLIDLGVAKSALGNHYNAIAGTTSGITTRWRNNVYDPLFPDAYVPSDPTNPDGTPAFHRNYDMAKVGNDVPNSGELLATAFPTDPTQTVAVHRQYALPLFSFLGLLSQKYAPLHNGYTIQITLNNQANALGAVCHYMGDTDTPTSTAATATVANTALNIISSSIDNIYFCAQVLELGPVAESMLLDSTGGAPLVVPTKAFRNYQSTIPEGSSSFKLDLGLNVASLTNILWMMRPTSQINEIRFRSLSNRVRNFLQNWYFQYGSSVLPQTSGINARGPSGQPVKSGGFTEAYVELLKARHGWNRDEHSGLINAENFTIDETVWHNDCYSILNEPNSTLPNNTIVAATRIPAVSSAAATNGWGQRGPYCPYLSAFNTSPVGKFACGLDLELVSGKTNDVICGMNTNGMNTSIFATFDPDYAQTLAYAVPHVRACRVDAWAEYDAFINISPSIATTVSF